VTVFWVGRNSGDWHAPLAAEAVTAVSGRVCGAAAVPDEAVRGATSYNSASEVVREAGRGVLVWSAGPISRQKHALFASLASWLKKERVSLVLIYRLPALPTMG